ncbi:MAG TPA: amino acid adenylation domain-containing protein, partial [Aquabacterium sp.]|nr:amino acid adenylation domain-containing protein [Aquabacterium sp.]HQC96631.1 amino acid adenylation domain-containing protein [Aquabacterium sp.]
APLQEGILFHHLMAQEGDTYLLRSLYSFPTRDGLQSLLAALQQVIDRHDILRTAVVWDGLPEPVQVVHRRATLPVQWLSLDAGQGDVAQQLEAMFDERSARIEVDQAPLLRCHVVEDAANGRHLLHVLAHHLVLDHTTMDLLLIEADAIEEGRLAELAEPVPFRHFVAQARLGVSAEEHEAFFRQMLGDVREPTAPFGVLSLHSDGGIDESRLVLDDMLSRQLRHQARMLGVSMASLAHLAWALVLARTTGREDVVFGTVLFGRMQAGVPADRMLGMFINTLPLRLQVGQASVEDSVRQTHALLARLMHHEHASLARAQRCSGVDAHMPLFTSLLNFRHSGQVLPAGDAQAADAAAADAPAQPAGVQELSASERSNYPVGLSVDDLGVALMLTVQAVPPIAAARLCGYMAAALQAVAQALQHAPRAPLSGLGILGPAERQQLLHDWNPAVPAPAEAPLLYEMFEAQALAQPERVAVLQGAETCRYGELDAQANRLAHYLRQQGVGPDERVAICAVRGLPLVQAVLAVMKAGGAYVPLDPAYPDERLAHMLRDSAPRVVLACGPLAGAALGRAGLARDAWTDLESDQHRWLSLPAQTLPRDARSAGPGNLAYVIYTSGSTGLPKGVMNEHRGLSNLVTAQIARFGIDADSRVLQFASPSFDASVSEIGTALACGAALCLAPQHALMPGRALLQTLQDMQVTHVTLPPSALPLCEAEDMPLHARTLIVAGEAVSVRDAAHWSRSRRLINAYGPTETTVCATTHDCQPDDDAASVPIGRPIAGMQVHVLDMHGHPAPVGVAGEIHIGGIGVARGYLNQPELTRQRFVPDPFSAQPGSRLYRSGDLGRWREDGVLEYLGRNDFQVKIRGFRIELGEIEARLAQHPAVREVVVLARQQASGDKRLVAYCVCHPGASTLEELRAQLPAALSAHLAACLPAFMVPAVFVLLERMPLGLNGKVDRQALPAPEGEDFGGRPYEAPQGEVEQALAQIWAELLEVERVGRQDSFFELGGHSLLAVQLLSRLRQRFGLELPLAELFVRPTLQALATCIADGHSAQAASGILVPLREAGSQRPLFVVHALEGNIGFVADLVPCLDADVPVYGVTALGFAEGETPLRTVPDMARLYIQAIRQAQPQGPYRLASWSAGGHLVYEMGLQLRQQGEAVEFIGMIDTLFRVTALSDELLKWNGGPEASLEQRDRAMLLVNLQHVLKLPARPLKKLAQLDSVDAILAGAIQELPELRDEDQFELALYKRQNAVQCGFVEAIRDYATPPSDLPVHLFAASQSQRKDPTLGWGAVLGPQLRVVTVKGDHQSIVQSPRIQVLGRLMSQALPRQVVPSQGQDQ